MKNLAIACITVFYSMFFSAIAFSKDKEIIRTNEVVVTATKKEKMLQDVPSSVSVITADEIQESSKNVIGDLLEDVPGVEVSNSGTQGLKRITIRGEGPRRVLILIDGQRISENKSLEGTPILIDPARIERIEVIKGPASVLYGADALGGVINIITKKGGSKVLEGEVSAGYNSSMDKASSFGYNGYASLFGKKNGFSYRGSISHSAKSDLRTPIGTQNHTKYDASDANIYLDYDFGNTKVGINYDYFRTYIESTAYGPDWSDIGFYSDMPSWTRNKISTFVEIRDITSYMSRVRFDIFVQSNEKEYENLVPPLLPRRRPVNVRVEALNKNKQFGSSLQTDWLIGENHFLIVGYDLNYDFLDTDNKTDLTVFVPIPGIPPMVINTKYSAEGYILTNALYAQMESTLPQDFTLSYGTRLSMVYTELSKLTGDAPDIGNAAGGFKGPAGVVGDNFYIYPVFNIGLTWSGVKHLTLRTLFSQGFRTPQLQERYINVIGAETFYANPNLKPEITQNIEVGARYSNYGINMDIGVFYSYADNYMDLELLSDNPARGPYKYSNIAVAQTFGIELLLSYLIPVVKLEPYISMSWMKRQYQYENFSTFDSGLPEFMGRVGIRYEKDFIEYGFLYFIDTYGRFASSVRYEASNRVMTQFDPWATLNMRTGFRFGKERQYYVDIIAENITNTLYISPAAIDAPGYIYEAGFYAGINIGAKF
ncbi:MAG: TonB-dependent receptor plug domain-containing protein [Desulfovibrionaceae bacterium]